MNDTIFTVFSCDIDTGVKKKIRDFIYSEGWNRRDAEHYVKKLFRETSGSNVEFFITSEWNERYKNESK